jgi:hypothetical protein
MRMKTLDTKGFAPMVLLIAAVAVLVIGGSAYVYHQDHKTTTTVANTRASKNSVSTSTSAATQPITAAELINVAKKVYWQTSDPSSKLSIVGFCDLQNNSCPFTTDLTNSIMNAKVGPGDGPTLIGGAQEGPFGTLAYSAAPTHQGGTVTVTLDAPSGDAPVTWKLAMIQDTGKLLVSDITYSRSNVSGAGGCGPVEIYDYSSCA